MCARRPETGEAYEVPVYETDREHLRKVPPLYHMVYGWGESPATKDEEGRLRFPQRFGLTRTQMVRMLAYLRSGVVVGNLEDLVETFVIFGGCHTPDTLLALQQERQGIVRMERDVAEIRRLQAPPALCSTRTLAARGGDACERAAAVHLIAADNINHAP